jgi:hypothetical protein
MFDKDTDRLVSIFRHVFCLSSFIDPDQAKYVKRHASFIENTGQLFEYLSLAELDEKSPLGWRPTPVLVYLMDEQAARKAKPSRRPISLQGRLLMRLLDDAVFGAESDGSCELGYTVLHELGLLREDGEGERGPTRRLLRLFDDGYFERQARRMGFPHVPPDYGRLVEILQSLGRNYSVK